MGTAVVTPAFNFQNELLPVDYGMPPPRPVSPLISSFKTARQVAPSLYQTPYETDEAFVALKWAIENSGCRILHEGTVAAEAYLDKYAVTIEGKKTRLAISSHAVYSGFTIWPPFGEPTFTNTIFLAKNAGNSKGAEWHEDIHVLQWNENPLMHATPLNQATNKMLCLRDFIALTILSEKEAYAKQAYFTWLASKYDPSIEAASNQYDIVPVSKFQQLVDESPDIETAIRKAGDFAMAKPRTPPKNYNGPVPYNLERHYTQQAIDVYKDSEERGFLKYGSNPVFVRMGEDIRSIGNTLNLQCLDHDGNDSLLGITSRFSEETWDEISCFNARNMIPDEENLQTLRQSVFEKDHESLDQYVANSKRARCKPDTTKPPEEGWKVIRIEPEVLTH